MPRGAPFRPMADRLLEKIAVVNGCWIWQGYVAESGYGRLTIAGRPGYAHRASYETFVGPIPDGAQIDHLCRVRACINPEHLEPVTQRENILRGSSPSAEQARMIECSAGHPFDVENTYVRANGKRECRRCVRERNRQWRAAHPEMVAAQKRRAKAAR